MSNPLLEFTLVCFTSLFAMLNPLNVVPVFISLTESLTQAEARRVAGKAVLMAAGILVLFALSGQAIFSFFSITINSLRVVGGIVLFTVGQDMLAARMIRTKQDDETTRDVERDITITPLAIPLICGPGAIATVIILTNDAPDALYGSIVFITIAVMMLLMFVSLLSGRRIMRVLGDSGNKVLMRLMGLIVMVIAVEFFVSGLTPIVRKILRIS